MLLCIVCDFVLLHCSIILLLLMALNMFVGGKFAHPGGGGGVAIPAGARKKPLMGGVLLNLNLITHTFL